MQMIMKTVESLEKNIELHLVSTNFFWNKE